MPSPRSIVRSGRDDGEGLAHHGRNKSRNSTHARRNSSGGASPDASHRLQQSNGNGPLTGSLYTFYEDSLLTDDEARLTEAEPDDASSSEEAEEKVEQLATESKKRFSDPGGLLAGLPGMVRRILVLCGSPFIFAWRLMVSACLLAEMMLSVVLHRLGVETTAQAQVDSLRRELNRSARQLQRVRERHHETLQRLEQAQRDKKHLQAALRKAREELDAQAGVKPREQSAISPQRRSAGSMIWLHSSVALLAASIYWLVEHPALQDLRGSYVIMGTAAMAAWFYVAGLLTRRAAGKRNRMVAVVLSWVAVGSIAFAACSRVGLRGLAAGLAPGTSQQEAA